jgi:hypothetical protein
MECDYSFSVPGMLPELSSAGLCSVVVFHLLWTLLREKPAYRRFVEVGKNYFVGTVLEGGERNAD